MPRPLRDEEKKALQVFRRTFRLDLGKAEVFFYHFQRAVEVMAEILGIQKPEAVTVHVSPINCPSCGAVHYVQDGMLPSYCSVCGSQMKGREPAGQEQSEESPPAEQKQNEGESPSGGSDETVER